jgi:hypothetical protein
MQAEDSLRLNLQNDSLRSQHRVARQDNHNNSNNDNNGVGSGEPKPPGYFSYPPQPHHADSYLTTTSSPDSHDDGTFRSRLHRVFNFPCSIYGKGLIGVIGVEALLVIIMQVVIVVLYFDSLVDNSLPPPQYGPNANVQLPPYLDIRNESRAIPAYLIVFVFAQLFQLVFAWDAVSVFSLSIYAEYYFFNMDGCGCSEHAIVLCGSECPQWTGGINTRRQYSIDTCSLFLSFFFLFFFARHLCFSFIFLFVVVFSTI